jgi:nucleoside-diphosphate-sugar epimerase
MKVLFIGGTGNISESVSRLCISQGIDLYHLNRGITSHDLEDVKLIKGDINDKEFCSKTLRDHEWDSVVNWIAFNEYDIERDINLFKHRTKQYVFISSVSVYQKPPSSPFVTEQTMLSNPYWKYSRDKIDCELRLQKEFDKNGFPYTIVRPGLTYAKMIPVPFGGYTIIDRIINGKEVIVHGDGTSIWQFTHSDDFARGFVKLLGRKECVSETFHITTDEVISWNQAFELMGEAVGVKPRIVHIPSDILIKYRPELKGILRGEWTNSIIFDNSKIKSFVPEFKAEIKFKEGIKRTIDWFRSDPDRMKINTHDNEISNRLITVYK